METVFIFSQKTLPKGISLGSVVNLRTVCHCETPGERGLKVSVSSLECPGFDAVIPEDYLGDITLGQSFRCRVSGFGDCKNGKYQSAVTLDVIG